MNNETFFGTYKLNKWSGYCATLKPCGVQYQCGDCQYFVPIDSNKIGTKLWDRESGNRNRSDDQKDEADER